MKKRINFANFLAICLSCIFVLCFLANVIETPNYGETIVSDGEEVVEELVITENEAESVPLEKRKFPSFIQAYRHAFNYLNNSKGYTSVSKGSSFAQASVVTNKQSLYFIKQVNKVNGTSYANVNTRLQSSFGADTAVEYYQSNNDVFYKRGWLEQENFVFPQDYNTTTVAGFNSEYSVSPVDLVVRLTGSMQPTNGRLMNNGTGYTLNFQLPIDVACKGAIYFCMKLCNLSGDGAFEVKPGTADFEVKMDYYGVITTLKTSVDFSCYFPKFPIVSIPLTLNGGFTIVEKFSNVDKLIDVHDFRNA